VCVPLRLSVALIAMTQPTQSSIHNCFAIYGQIGRGRGPRGDIQPHRWRQQLYSPMEKKTPGLLVHSRVPHRVLWGLIAPATPFASPSRTRFADSTVQVSFGRPLIGAVCASLDWLLCNVNETSASWLQPNINRFKLLHYWRHLWLAKTDLVLSLAWSSI